MLNFRKARKKSIVEAVQITEELLHKLVGKTIESGNTKVVFFLDDFAVKTLEGVMYGHIGDYLMRGVEGELYICEKEIFEKSYEFISE